MEVLFSNISGEMKRPAYNLFVKINTQIAEKKRKINIAVNVLCWF